jgi:hypothetical protein
MIGVPTGKGSGLDVIDIDVKKANGFDAVPSWRRLSPVIVSTPSGGAHLLFRSTGVVRNTTGQIGPGVDTRGEGGYVIVPPSHNHAGAYNFKFGRAEDISNLPLFPRELLDRLAPHHQDPKPSATTAEPRDIAAALHVIPNPDLGWDDWNRIGMAIWSASGGTADGFECFNAWSQKSHKYNAVTTRKRWEGYAKSPPTQIGAGTIFHLAKEANSARVAALAELDELTYEQQRKTAAKELGVRPSKLDKLVEQHRQELADCAGSGFLQPVEPWGERWRCPAT